MLRGPINFSDKLPDHIYFLVLYVVDYDNYKKQDNFNRLHTQKIPELLSTSKSFLLLGEYLICDVIFFLK